MRYVIRIIVRSTEDSLVWVYYNEKRMDGLTFEGTLNGAYVYILGLLKAFEGTIGIERSSLAAFTAAKELFNSDYNP